MVRPVALRLVRSNSRVPGIVYQAMQPIALDHVQLAMPEGGEDRAREFYAGVLGLSEVQKPAMLAMNGGAWFKSGDVELHLGVERDFAPARKAHPALLYRDLDWLAVPGRVGRSLPRRSPLLRARPIREPTRDHGGGIGYAANGR